MTDSVTFNRRDFLKLVGLGGIGVAGCAQPAEKLIPYLVPPEDIAAAWEALCRRADEIAQPDDPRARPARLLGPTGPGSLRRSWPS